jgi:hypothetical protein
VSGAAASFETTLLAFGNNTGVEVPEAVLEQLDAGRRPPVRVVLNGHEFRTTVGVMKGMHLVPVSKAVREASGLSAGDTLAVTLTVDESPREVDMPADLAAALAAAPAAATFFEGLSNSLQRYHVGQVTSAKTEATRQRRIDKAVQLFLDGKQR